jgi:TolB protein
MHQLTQEQSDEHPVWSPDGSKIAFDRVVFARGAAVGQIHVFVVNADGTGLRDVVGKAGLGGLSWSPDGRRLAYRDAEGAIRTVALDGSVGPTLYRSDVAHDPAWSPDARRIVFVEDSFNLGSNGRLLEVAASGGRPKTLLEFKGHDVYSESAPAFSPDGKRIAIVRSASEGGGRPSAIELVRSDGGGRRVLTTLQLSSDDAELARPSWSPDGKTLAFVDIRGGRFGLWSIPSGGGDAKLLLPGVKDASAAWPPDSG